MFKLGCIDYCYRQAPARSTIDHQPSLSLFDSIRSFKSSAPVITVWAYCDTALPSVQPDCHEHRITHQIDTGLVISLRAATPLQAGRSPTSHVRLLQAIIGCSFNSTDADRSTDRYSTQMTDSVKYRYLPATVGNSTV